tara:strand:- start:788 stop:961 length:174 start_codon:yes stop_codon:yes gene_type:complete
MQRRQPFAHGVYDGVVVPRTGGHDRVGSVIAVGAELDDGAIIEYRVAAGLVTFYCYL